MADALAVHVDGLHLADVELVRWNDLRLRYTAAAHERWPQNTPLLSCSLPLAPGRLKATAFCRGLLAEGRALDAMANRAGVATNDTFGLLARYGRDVAGAMSIATVNAPGRRAPHAVPYSGDELATAIDSLDRNPLAIEDDSELSLAGIQDKLLLVKTEDGWARPAGGEPSTHILKVDDLRRPGLIAAEYSCLKLAAAAGLDVASAEFSRIGEHDCLIVERFDRRLGPGGAARVHQEDACQALGIDPTGNRGRAKYERAGGPTLAQVALLLDVFADNAVGEMTKLLELTSFNVLIGNADAHGKNISLLHEPLGTTRLAPIYDIVPTVLWTSLRTEAAMAIGGATDITEVTRTNLRDAAVSWGLTAGAAEASIDLTVDAVLHQLDHIKSVHPGLAAHVRSAAARLAAE